MKVKISLKSQPVRYMCHADTCVSYEIRAEQIQFPLHLADTVDAKKICPLIKGVAFSKVGQDQPYFRNLLLITFIPIFEVDKVSERHRGNFGQRKK